MLTPNSQTNATTVFTQHWVQWVLTTNSNGCVVCSQELTFPSHKHETFQFNLVI
jgi:hypothetical protein